MIVTLASCHKEKKESDAPKYYTFIGVGEWESCWVTCYEHDSNNVRVASHTFKYEADNPHKFTAASKASMVKVQFHFTVEGDQVTSWLREIYQLKDNENIDIVSNPDDQYTDSEPNPTK